MIQKDNKSLTREERIETIEKAVEQILWAIGEDVNRSGIKDTPTRVAKAWIDELCIGLRINPDRHLERVFEEELISKGIVVVAGIDFESLCEHHLLPFSGKIHVGYLPSGNKIVGISKLARVSLEYAARPQVQERLNYQIITAINEKLNPRGAGVIIEAIHTCMCMRGVRKQGAVTVTSEVRGLFNEELSVKEEFLKLVYPYRMRVS